jgi:uncharacterized protein (DUF2141 family)
MLLQAFEDTHWGDTVTLALLQGAITNAMGQSSAIDTFTVVIPKKEDVGSVTITIDDTFIATPHLISLFDNLNRLILQCNSCATLSSAALLPGNYHIEIIEDRNNNGRWDEGDFLRGLQPERRYWRKDAVQIKPNWDITIEVKP